ncbi:hypothetical protein M758_7G005800 [Ceratodon purpureus]|uniref:Uncharacterized protein n=1 Tax=Ceratodon purpureus TaxID=3225 RepID=A0A8T0H4L3_CERPU|nr:hypothetical protein KC19_7G006100 [Ceratodon purpureus]KAG0609683.1 hypothetical protein M758_7G005800 [Ceratodon purpureus]
MTIKHTPIFTCIFARKFFSHALECWKWELVGSGGFYIHTRNLVRLFHLQYLGFSCKTLFRVVGLSLEERERERESEGGRESAREQRRGRANQADYVVGVQ